VPAVCDRIFCVFVAGTLDKVNAPNIKAGVESVKKLFDDPDLKPKVGPRVTNLEGVAATPEAIKKACEGLDLKKNDSVFFFYCGHGGTLEGKGQCLFPLSDPAQEAAEKKVGPILPREEVVGILMKKSPRFICFVTDACSTLLPKGVLPSVEYKAAGKTDKPALTKVMLASTGVFDVNSSSYDKEEKKGQVAFIVKGGGLFTQEFVRLSKANDLGDKDGKVKWKADFYPKLKDATNEAFKKLRADDTVDKALFGSQKSQIPERFPRDETPTRLDAEPVSAEPVSAGAAAGHATLTVTLPADATLAFDGRQTLSAGGLRTFDTPPLAAGKTYSYTLTATRLEGGKAATLTRKVSVRAGETTAVRITDGDFQKLFVASR
jgi:uncharacterized protein (TIGR03000 family)